MKNKTSQEEIEKLIEEFQESGARELHVRYEGFEMLLSHDSSGDITVQTDMSVNEQSSTAEFQNDSEETPTSVVKPSQEPLDDDSYIQIKAPYMGVFYRAPKPGTKPYVEVGQKVATETEMCLVEVMKLFTAVRAGVQGVVKKVLVEDGSMIQVGQPLFLLEVAE